MVKKLDIIKEQGRAPVVLKSRYPKCNSRHKESLSLINDKEPGVVIMYSSNREMLEDYKNTIGNRLQNREGDTYTIKYFVGCVPTTNGDDLYCLVHLETYRCDLQRKWDKYITPLIKLTDDTGYLEYGHGLTQVEHKTFAVSAYVEDPRDLYEAIDTFIESVRDYCGNSDICCRRPATLTWEIGSNEQLRWEINCRLEKLPPV